MDCGPADSGARIHISIPLAPNDAQNLLDEVATKRLLEGAANLLLTHCQQFLIGRGISPQFNTVSVDINPAQLSGRFVSATLNVPTKTWEIKNFVALEAAAKKQQMEAAQQSVARNSQIGQERDSSLRAFVQANGITTFVPISTLSANPFPYVGKVVGVRTSFGNMMSASEARFDDLFVSGVSPTMFTQPGTQTVLAVRVTGLKPVKIPGGGEMSFPYGSLVAAHLCTQPRCAEFFVQ